MHIMKNIQKIVLKDYPKATAVNMGKYFEVWSENTYLGKGKSKDNAWKAAYNNIND